MRRLTGLLQNRGVLSLGVVFGVRVLVALGGIGLSVVIARMAGAGGLGQVTFALALATVMSTVARSGLDIALLKAVAGRLTQDGQQDSQNASKPPNQHPSQHPDRRHAAELPGHLGDVLGTTTLWALGLCLPLAALAMAGWPAALGSDAARVLIWAVLPLTVLAVIAGYLRGIARVAVASVVDVSGIALLAALVLGALYLAGWTLSAGAIAAIILALVVACALASAAWAWRDAQARAGGAPGRSADAAAALRTGRWYLMWSALAALVTQTGAFVLVGPVLDDGELGLARAAERLAVLITFPLTAVNPFIAPRIVRHVTLGDAPGMRRLIAKACLASTLPALPLTLALCLAPVTALALFGPDFAAAAPILQIMALTQLATAATAPVSQLLYLGGHERTLTGILLATMVLGLVLFPLGAALAGGLGFALAYAAVNGIKAGLILAYARRRGAI